MRILSTSPGIRAHVRAEVVALVALACLAAPSGASALSNTAITQFTNDANASGGSANPTAITAGQPRFSWINDFAASVTKQRVQVVTDPPTNVVGLWHFDGDLTDDSGNGYDLTQSAAPVPFTTGPAGFGQGVLGDGVDNHATVTNAAFDLPDNTVEAWLKVTSFNRNAASHNFAVTKGTSSTNRNYALGVAAPTAPGPADGQATCEVSVAGSAKPDLRSTTRIDDGLWHYVVCTYDNATGKHIMYVDGVAENNATYAGSVDLGVGAPVAVGAKSDGGDAFNGMVDDVRISNVVRTPAEILGYFQTQAPHFQTVWDSDPGNTGATSLSASCAASARCADIAYDSSGSPAAPLRADGRYYARAKFEPTAGPWNAWGGWDWFEMSPSPLLAVGNLFTNDASAAASATRPTTISNAAPHFSLQNTSGTAATAQRVQVLSSPMANVVALYQFDSATGTSTDMSSEANPLVGTNGAPSYPASAAGFGTALSLNGTDSRWAAYEPALDLTTNFTVETWMKTSTNPAGQGYIVSKQATGAPWEENINLVLDGPGNLLRFEVTKGTRTTVGTVTTPSAPLRDGTWHHVAAVYDGANLILYVDGNQANAAAFTGSIDVGSAQRLVIGSDVPTGGQEYIGLLDDLAISNVARSAQEIKAYYQSGKPHGATLWDSDPADAGVAVACGVGARCADAVYGSSGSAAAALAFAGDRYWVRGKLRTAAGAWGAWSAPDWFQTTTNTVPNAPTALAQFKANGSTAIASGAWTTDGASTNVVLTFNASDPNASQTLTPWVEVRPNATAFSATCGTAGAGMFSGAGVAAPTGGTSYGMTVNVTGLSTDTLYHWRACTVDQSGALSAWVNKGASPDFKVDSAATAPATVNDGTGADVAASTSTTQLSGNWTAAGDGSGSGVASYDWCINETADCVTTIVSSGSVASPTVGFTKSGLTLTAGMTYYVCARTVDVLGNTSTYACSNGQAVVAAPGSLFTHDSNASAGAANATGITAAAPHFSLVNSTGLTVNKQRTQVWSDPLDPSVVALWHMDTATGATVDATGNGHALTFTAAPTSPAGQSNFGQSLGLNGTTQYATTPATASLDLANDFTVDAWFKTSTIAGNAYPTIVSKSADTLHTNFNIDFAQVGNALEFEVSVGNVYKAVQVPAAAYVNGQWHHTALVVDGSNQLLAYVDGTQVGSTLTLGGPVDTAPATSMWIGNNPGATTHFFNGEIDDVRVLNRALTTAEIAGYYNTAQPHGTVLWDSDATDAGVALASCNNSVRCADIVYGGANINRLNARYWVMGKYKTAGGSWSAWSSPDWYQTVVNVAPNAPATLAQFKANGTTAIASGAWTTDGASTNVVLKYDASDPNASQTLTPWVEVRPNATAFSGTCGTAGAGMFSGAGVAAPTGGTSYGMTVNVTGLSTDTLYHWRACVVDQSGGLSAWVNKGASPDFKVDSTATAPTPVNDGTGADVASTSSTSQISGNWTAAADGSGSGVASYDWCINETADCVTTIVSSGSVTSPTVGFTKSGLTLAAGTNYYVCARTIDAMGNASTYTCSNGQTVLTAPTGLFTHDTNAGAGSANPTGILSATPHFSLLNSSGLTVNKQRTQVWSDILDSSVVALWHMDTGTGVTADATGNGHTLSLTAAPTSPAGQTSFNQALGLNGTTQSVSGGTAPAYNLSNNFTVSTWFSSSSIANSAYPVLVQKGSGGCTVATCNFSLEFDRGASSLSALASTGAARYGVSATATPYLDGLWHHAALTVDASNNLRLYVDGVQLGTTTALGAPAVATSDPLTIGAASTGADPFQGKLDDVEIQGRALSTAEIAGYYNTAQPHGTVLWDSDATDAGVALASCNTGVRCADVVYGGANINRLNARYWVTAKYKTAGGLWTPWSAPDWYQTVVNVAPNAAAALAQYRSNGTTAIGSGAWTTDGASTNVVLKFTASDPNSGETLTPWVEVRPNATAFSGTCGSAGGGMFSGTAVAAPTAGTSYAMSVNVTGLSTDTQYHWRACTVDAGSALSGWVNKGASPDFQVDSTATAPTPVNDGTGADVASASSTSQISGNWTAATDGSGSGVASYDWCINETADCVTTIVSSGSVTSPTVAFTKSGLTLTAGTTYYVCARTVDAVGNTSAYTCSNGQIVMPVPNTLFTDNVNASAGSTHPTNITAATPHFSLVNSSGLTVDKQRAQVWSDPLDPNVVSLWHMDTGTGVASDATGNGHTLSPVGGPSSPASAASFGQSLGLNGTSQYGTAAVSAAYDLSNNFTVDAWFTTSSIAGSAYPTIVSKWLSPTNANFNIDFDRSSSNLEFEVSVGGVYKGIQVPGAGWVDGGWHHAALVVSASNQLMAYVDGGQVGSTTPLGGAVDMPASQVHVGENGFDLGYYFNGQIDDVRIMNRALTSAEIAGYYNTAQPHGTVLWDSDATDAGAALASCNTGVRCADIVYGTPNITRQGARYFVTGKYRSASGTWSPWSTPDWFETLPPTITVGVDSSTAGLAPSMQPTVDAVATTALTVTTNAAGGYTLSATDEDDAWGLRSAASVPLADYAAPCGAPTAWTAGSAGGFGITVTGVTGATTTRLGKWGTGTGTAATDFVNNSYCGLKLGSSALLHQRNGYSTAPDTVTVAYRGDAPNTQAAGTYTGQVTYLASALL